MILLVFGSFYFTFSQFDWKEINNNPRRTGIFSALLLYYQYPEHSRCSKNTCQIIGIEKNKQGGVR